MVRLVSLLLAVGSCVSLFGATAIPSAGAPGVRVLVAERGIEAAASVSFPAAGGQRLSSVILARGNGYVETTVPVGSITGSINAIVGTVVYAASFTVTADHGFATVRTVARSTTGQLPFHNPEGIAYAEGLLVLADTKHHQISIIERNGQVRVLAGNGSPGSADGLGAHARFKEPKGLAYDPLQHALYVADSGNHTIRRVTLDGIVTTIAGTGQPGDTDGPVTVARFRHPTGLALGPDGLYVADTDNHAIRRITNGLVATIAGTGHAGFQDGEASQARFASPTGIAIGTTSIFVSDTGNHRLRAITANNVTTLVGNGQPGANDGIGIDARLRAPHGITLDPAGRILIADSGNNLVRSLDPTTHHLTTIAGQSPTNARPELVDGSPATARFANPTGLALGDGLYVVDTDNDAVRHLQQSLLLAAIYPPHGPTAGSTILRILGQGFTPTTTLTIGGLSTSVTFIDATELLAASPAHAPGMVDVHIVDGAQDRTLTNAFTYLPRPTLTNINPRNGATAGGAVAVIRGTGFLPNETSFTLGAAAAIATIESADAATITTPPGTHGPATLAVTTPGGTATAADAYRYFAPPVVTSITPTSGPAGTTVTISGNHFDTDLAGNVVHFANSTATIQSATSEQLVVTAPATSGPVSVTTPGGTGTGSVPFMLRALQQLTVTPTTATIATGATVSLLARAHYSDGTSQDASTTSSWGSNSERCSVTASGVVTGTQAGTCTITATLQTVSAHAVITIADGDLPPDPALIAPPNDPTITTSFVDSVTFLYQGPNPTQRDVTPGSLVPRRVAVIRGRVIDHNGTPVAGAKVSAHNSPQTGVTHSRADGWYDLVVNGGSKVTVQIEKPGHITVHRGTIAPWNDFAMATDATLIPYDPAATAIDLPQVQGAIVARGTASTDEDGTRQATLIFREGTEATAHRPNGEVQDLPLITVRATEQTIGRRGAMPATLPITSGYTYCVELSVDEAIDATRVSFSQPVAVYLENFLNMPTGTAIPVGYYDRARAVWVAADNGRIIRVVEEQNGKARLDFDGDGIPEDEAQRGIPAAELAELARLYEPGTTLWRVEVTHFTPWDFNHSVIIPANARGPRARIQARSSLNGEHCEAGSEIDCESLVLGQAIQIEGTPHQLSYRTRSAYAFKNARTIDVQLTDAELPPVKRIELTIDIAGQSRTITYTPQANLRAAFTWDGKDVYGRPTYADRTLTATVSFVYDANYSYLGDPGTRLFPGTGEAIGDAREARGELFLSQTSRLLIRGPEPTQALGGWRINAIHSLDVASSRVHRGNGTEMTLAERGAGTTKAPWISGFDVHSLRAGGDGSLYSFNGGFGPIQRLSSDGETSAIGGGGRPAADGVPINEAAIATTDMIAMPDGEVMLADSATQTIYRTERGVLRAVTRAEHLDTLALSPDGSILFTTQGSLRRMDPSGDTTTLATGTARREYSGVRVGADGNVYVLITDRDALGSTTQTAIYRWPSRELVTVAAFPREWTADTTGRFYYIDNGNAGPAIQVIEADGTRHPLGTTTPVGSLTSFAVLPNGVVAYAEVGGQATCGPNTFGRCIMLAGTTLSKGAPLIPESGGEIAYRFTTTGRHTQTIATRSKAVLATIGYENGIPVTLRDANGRITGIQRSATSATITAPNGQTTRLTYDNQGRAEKIETPSGTHLITYDSAGLLRTYTRPDGRISTYTYDDDGLLASVELDGHTKQFQQSMDGNRTRTTIITATGIERTYEVERTSSDTYTRRTSTIQGTTTVSESPLGQETTYPDGSIVRITRQDDTRWQGMSTYAAALTVTLPSGRQASLTAQRFATSNQPTDPLAFASLTSRMFIGNRMVSSLYTAQDRRERITTAAGRQVTRFYDTAGRITTINYPGMAPLTFLYDGNGRLHEIAQGTRKAIAKWDDHDRLIEIGTPTRRATLAYETRHLPTSVTTPGNHTTHFTYDDNARIASITPPSGKPYTLARETSGLPKEWQLPNGSTWSYHFDPDERLTGRTFAGQNSSVTFDASGRVRETNDGTTTTYTYNNAGYPTTVAGQGAVVGFEWDGYLPTKQTWAGSMNASVSWGYDNELRVSSETIANSPITYTYDADALLLTAGALTLTRNAATGQVSSTRVGVTTEEFTYNEYGEPSRIATKHEGVIRAAWQMQRNDQGKIASITDLDGTTSYDYDTDGRLATVTRGATITAEYEYDANGNRLAHRWPGGSNTAEYDDLDRVTQYGATTFTYRSDGATASKDTAGALTTYDYDTRGHLRNVSLPGGHTVSYQLDPLGRRVGRAYNGAVTARYAYSDDLRIIAQLSGANTITSRFVYAGRSNVPDFIIREGNTYRIVADHLGSPRLVMHVTTGTVVQEVRYDEFGNVTFDSNPGFQPFGFAGGLYDTDTRLVHFGAREYDPSTGRWMTPDPMLFAGGGNLYQYSFGDPLNYLDRDGRAPLPVVTGIIGGVAGGIGSAIGQIIANRGFDCFSWTDVGIATGVGAVAGALAPITATTTLGAAVSGGFANVAQTYLTDQAHGKSSGLNEYGASFVLGMIGGGFGGPVYTGGAGFNEGTLYGSRALFKQMNHNENVQRAIGDAGRAAGGAYISAQPVNGACGCR